MKFMQKMIHPIKIIHVRLICGIPPTVLTFESKPNSVHDGLDFLIN